MFTVANGTSECEHPKQTLPHWERWMSAGRQQTNAIYIIAIFIISNLFHVTLVYFKVIIFKQYLPTVDYIYLLLDRIERG